MSDIRSVYNPAIKYRPEIDGLRAVAVLPVILFHAGFERFSGGFVGVDVFFVLSGYLITSIILKELSQESFSIVRFYERRARRILPALFCVVVCTMPLAYLWLLPDELQRFGGSLVGVATFTSNIFFWKSTDYFSPDAENELLLHTWSLSVEEQFYVLFPIFLWILWRYCRSKLIILVALVAVGSFALCEWGWRNDPILNFYLLPTRAWELLVGSLAALWLASVHRPMNVSRSAREFLVGAGFAAIVASTLLFDESTPFPSYYAAIPTLGTALIVVFANGGEVTSRLLSLRPVVFVGLISYSGYLWHQPIFALMRMRGFGELTEVHFGAGAILSLLLAALTWRFIEIPYRKRSGATAAESKTSTRTVFGATAAGLCLALFSGVAISQIGLKDQLHFQPGKEGIPDKCRRLVQFDDRDCNWRVEPGGRDPVMVLWGDSFANAFSMSLIRLAQAESVTVYPLIFHSCPSLLGTARNEAYRKGPQFAKKCTDYTERASSFIVDLKPDVVVLANAYEWYSSAVNLHDEEPILIDVGDRGLSGRDVVLDSLERTVNYLNRSGIGVVVPMPHPISADFRQTMRRSKISGNGDHRYDLNRTASQDLSIRMVSRLNSSGLDFRPVFPDKLFCDIKEPHVSNCSSMDREGNYLLFDGSHISDRLAPAYAKEVFEASRFYLQ